jgi:hypothetical protein
VFISQAFTELLGRTDLFAWRPTGEIFVVTNNGAIRDVRTGKPRNFNIKGSDICSNDWRIGDAEKLRKDLPHLFADEAA